ncbi:hypothetical protein [Mycobacterium sp. 852002-51971_SCH5477799-a]|nr:hypothetical protein [Mycobacterium sp. 852002-51971_SCH5477799-a]
MSAVVELAYPVQPVKIQTLLAVKGDVVDPDLAGEGAEMKHAFPTASS